MNLDFIVQLLILLMPPMIYRQVISSLQVDDVSVEQSEKAGHVVAQPKAVEALRFNDNGSLLVSIHRNKGVALWSTAQCTKVGFRYDVRF